VLNVVEVDWSKIEENEIGPSKAEGSGNKCNHWQGAEHSAYGYIRN
jgi:hypothetical protein